jgi:WD40 repeat protein
MAWSPTGKFLATGSVDDRVLIWDVDLRKRFHTFKGHIYPVTSLAWSPTGWLLAAGDRKIRLYDVGTREWLAMLGGKNGRVNCLAWHPRKESLLASGVQGHVEFWDVESEEVCRDIGGLPADVTCLAW